MNGEALGVIETVGMAAAIEAADSCVKSADVELIGYELSKGSGLVTIKIKGNVGAVKAAIEAAKISAGRINKIYATLVIPRPAKSLDRIIESESTVGIQVKKREEECQKEVEVIEKEEIQVQDELENQEKEVSEEKEKLVDPKEENVIEEDKKSIKKIKEENIHIDEQESDEVCNICHDPKCPRKKGQPRNLCINSEVTRG
ncbi:BMC domain-containing protein [Clostridium aciditolerans]|uniref:BMC domain-containing protein n=1 Tax=Clostridium aciditolerans TaxID=339861 RepID=A0A934M6A9_9CLOT|nr:BMC domain-containing protein [Clostridium aciditolerans]MBI6874378.1 BMC domain-containing protein [Clostridium aciditolerans]